MFVKESLRLYPPVPAIGRQLEHPMKIKSDMNSTTESTLPANSMIGLNIMALQRNPLVWENPDVSFVYSVTAMRLFVQQRNTFVTE